MLGMLLLRLLVSGLVVPRLLSPLQHLPLPLLQHLVHAVGVVVQAGLVVVAVAAVAAPVVVVGAGMREVTVAMLTPPPIPSLRLLRLPLCVPCMVAVSRVRWSPV